MKKILSLIFSILMVVTCVTFVGAVDFTFESGKQVAYVVGDAGTPVDGKFTVPVYLYWSSEYTGNVATGAFQIKYDTEKLTYESATANSAIFDMAFPGTPATGIIGCTFANFMKPALAKPADGGILLFEIVFKVNEGVYGNIPVEFNASADAGVQNVADSSAQPVTFQLVNGSVIIPAPDRTVTFDMNGHGEAIDPVTKEHGTKITLPSPSKDGHFSFGGWSDGNDTFAGGSQYELTQSITLKAIWVEDEKFDVTFVSDYGTAPVKVTGKYAGEPVELIQLTDDSGTWKHIGWTDGTSTYEPTGVYTVVDGENELEAIWEEFGVALATFTTEKGTKPEDIKKHNNDPVGTADTTITLPNIIDTIANWTFNGWQKNGEGEVFAAGSSVVLEEGTTTFVAVWKEDPKATVTYVDNIAIAPEAVTDYVGKTVVVAEPGTAPAGYDFLGWTDGTATYQPGDEITIGADGITLAAKWGVKVTVNVGGAEGDVPVIGGEIGETIDDLPGVGNLTKAHHTFLGWSETENGAIIETYTIKAENNVLYAVWKEDPKATVTYVDNIATAPEAVTDYVGKTVVVAEPGTAPAGYNFLGWTDGSATYQAGDEITLDADGITLTAKWGAKVTINVGGAKGEIPEIADEIGKTVTLPGMGTLTKANHTFLGWSETENGAIIETYTIKAENNVLYAVWEEVVANAAIIETKATYYSGTGDYLVDVYFYGKNANTTAFGYKYGENLTFAGFIPSEGFSIPHSELEIDSEDGYYAVVVALEAEEGYIPGESASAGNGIHLGTLAFTFSGTKEDYAQNDTTDNIQITAPLAEIEHISSNEYFLYTPFIPNALEVECMPVIFDEVIDFEIINVVYPVKGSVELIREDGVEPRNFATLKVINSAGVTLKTYTIESEDTETEDGIFDYEIELSEGEYTLQICKTGYLASEIEVVIEDQEGSGQEGFEPDPVILELVTLTPGDVVWNQFNEFGTIDLFDFVAITSAFGRDDLTAEEITAIDINEDGEITVSDLNYIKSYLISE